MFCRRLSVCSGFRWSDTFHRGSSRWGCRTSVRTYGIKFRSRGHWKIFLPLLFKLVWGTPSIIWISCPSPNPPRFFSLCLFASHKLSLRGFFVPSSYLLGTFLSGSTSFYSFHCTPLIKSLFGAPETSTWSDRLCFHWVCSPGRCWDSRLKDAYISGDYHVLQIIFL